MSDKPSVRINKVLRELNISLDRVSEFFIKEKNIKLILDLQQKLQMKFIKFYWMNLRVINLTGLLLMRFLR